MTHDDLVKRAGRWLKNTRKCKLVVLESAPWNCSEHPDAIGWTPDGESIVVEAKVSWPDFNADKYKPWRQMSVGMGFLRYYMVPYGLIGEKDIMHLGTPGLGLLEVRGRVVKVLVEAAPRQQRDFIAEVNLLVSRHDAGKWKCNKENPDG